MQDQRRLRKLIITKKMTARPAESGEAIIFSVILFDFPGKCGTAYLVFLTQTAGRRPTAGLC